MGVFLFKAYLIQYDAERGTRLVYRQDATYASTIDALWALHLRLEVQITGKFGMVVLDNTSSLQKTNRGLENQCLYMGLDHATVDCVRRSAREGMVAYVEGTT